MATTNAFDLDAMSADDLTKLIEEAKAKLDSKKGEAKNALIEEMRTKAAALGISLEELMPARSQPQTNVRRPRADAGKSIAVKYRGPGGQTWTGRGRKPTWLAKMEAQGKKKEEFAV
jgi:DNA-binding protein H-NS